MAVKQKAVVDFRQSILSEVPGFQLQRVDVEIVDIDIARRDARWLATAWVGTRAIPVAVAPAVRRLFETLLSGEWIDAHDNLAICGPTGIGKSWLACSIGHKACRDNRSVLYVRFTRLLDELALARGDGRIASRLKSLASV